MRKWIRRAVMAVLAVVLLGSCTMLVRRWMDYRQGEEAYAEAETLVELPDLSALETPQLAQEVTAEESEEAPVYVDPYADALRDMDFTALREVNSDVLGWILIPGTVISYPLLQGEDNQYYLTHTWKKWTSAVGAIFLECSNSPDLSDFNTIVYGHRMNNGSMFASLKNYKTKSYWSAHPCVYITNDAGTHKYDIFAAYEVSTEGSTYQIGFSSDDSKQAFLDYCMAQSTIDTGIVPTVYDRILTLSTCTGRGHATRWVVQAVLRGEAPAEDKEETPAETAPAPEAETAPAPETETAPAPETETIPAPEAETAPAPETETAAPAEESQSAEATLLEEAPFGAAVSGEDTASAPVETAEESPAGTDGAEPPETATPEETSPEKQA